MICNVEVWRAIDNFPLYEVSNFGQVRSWQAKKPRILKPSTVMGYLQVALRRNKKSHYRKVHRLVLESFCGFRPPGMECRHLDGNRLNNRIDNLQWGTKAENVLDIERHGKVPKGELHGRSKLTEADVREIIAKRKSGMTLTAIAAEHAVNHRQVSHICTGKNWKHVSL